MSEQVGSADEIREAVRERMRRRPASSPMPRVRTPPLMWSVAQRQPWATRRICSEPGSTVRLTGMNSLIRPGLPAWVAAIRRPWPSCSAGEIVLDLGSGGGIDVLLSARRVGPTGLAYGLDMTDEMLALARANQHKARIDNVRWLRGHIEDIPLPAASVDVVISNCVINLSGDKPQVLRETARVLRPGGCLAVSDVIADEGMDEATRKDMEAFTGCIAGALTRAEYARALTTAGLVEVTIEESHRVHEHAGSAIIRARKPGGQLAAQVGSVAVGLGG